MTTALSMITRAYRLPGLLGSGEVLTADRSMYALDLLNDLIDSWATEGLYCKEVTEVIATVPAGATFTVGPGQTVPNSTAPVRLEEGGFFRSGGVDYPFDLKSREEYMDIAYKGNPSPWPSIVFYNPGTNFGTAYMFPSLGSPAQIHLQVMTPLTEFASLTADVKLPLGYKKAITESLAEQLCIGKRPVDPQLMKSAKAARMRIKEANAESPNLRSWTPQMGNILTGWEL